MSMKRYDAVNTYGDPLYAPSPDGEMVFYSDVAKWVSAEKRLPKDNQGILMVTNNGKIYSGLGRVFKRELKSRAAGNGYVSDYYTHWQPLPLPPSEGE